MGFRHLSSKAGRHQFSYQKTPPRPRLEAPAAGVEYAMELLGRTESDCRSYFFSIGLPSVRHSPLPLQSFLPLVLPQPPLPLPVFCAITLAVVPATKPVSAAPTRRARSDFVMRNLLSSLSNGAG